MGTSSLLEHRTVYPHILYIRSVSIPLLFSSLNLTVGFWQVLLCCRILSITSTMLLYERILRPVGTSDDFTWPIHLLFRGFCEPFDSGLCSPWLLLALTLSESSSINSSLPTMPESLGESLPTFRHRLFILFLAVSFCF